MVLGTGSASRTVIAKKGSRARILGKNIKTLLKFLVAFPEMNHLDMTKKNDY